MKHRSNNFEKYLIICLLVTLQYNKQIIMGVKGLKNRLPKYIKEERCTPWGRKIGAVKFTLYMWYVLSCYSYVTYKHMLSYALFSIWVKKDCTNRWTTWDILERSVSFSVVGEGTSHPPFLVAPKKIKAQQNQCKDMGQRWVLPITHSHWISRYLISILATTVEHDCIVMESFKSLRCQLVTKLHSFQEKIVKTTCQNKCNWKKEKIQRLIKKNTVGGHQ